MAISSKIMLYSYPSNELGPGHCSHTCVTHFTKREGCGKLGVLNTQQWSSELIWVSLKFQKFYGEACPPIKILLALCRSSHKTICPCCTLVNSESWQYLLCFALVWLLLLLVFEQTKCSFYFMTFFQEWMMVYSIHSLLAP